MHGEAELNKGYATQIRDHALQAVSVSVREDHESSESVGGTGLIASNLL
jgi:hypothetical protein